MEPLLGRALWGLHKQAKNTFEKQTATHLKLLEVDPLGPLLHFIVQHLGLLWNLVVSGLPPEPTIYKSWTQAMLEARQVWGSKCNIKTVQKKGNLLLVQPDRDLSVWAALPKLLEPQSHVTDS